MEKRYQVFVSSTFVDLQNARKEVMQALLELDCIPSGMELFPAADEDQWSLIRKVIDDSDYYIVILAGRYGSIGPEGYSYTEMEYRYATEIGKPIIGFVHKAPGSLAADLCEKTDEGKSKLESFRNLTQKKLCRFWETPSDLGSQVSRSLIQLIKSKPAIGWVRGDLVPAESSAEEILKLRRRIDELEKEIQSKNTSEPKGIETLAKGDDTIEITYEFQGTLSSWNTAQYTIGSEISWDNLFAVVSPIMINEASDHEFKLALNGMAKELFREDHKDSEEFSNMSTEYFEVIDDDFHTIKVQLRALGLITQSIKNRRVQDTSTYWTLTPYGDALMTTLRAIHKT